MQRLSISAAGFLMATCVASQAQTPGTDRALLMRGMQDRLNELLSVVQGKSDYSPAAASGAIAAMAANASKLPPLWPPDSPSDPKRDYRSSPKIWESKAQFDANLVKLQQTLAAASPVVGSGEEKLGAAVAQINQVCRDCHEQYRVRSR